MPYKELGARHKAQGVGERQKKLRRKAQGSGRRVQGARLKKETDLAQGAKEKMKRSKINTRIILMFFYLVP
jgi:hypothetical protein